MSPVGGISSVMNAGTLMRGYGLRGDAAVSAPSSGGLSINAADLKFANAGRVTGGGGDVFMPSFPQMPHFQDYAPLLSGLPQAVTVDSNATPLPADEPTDEPIELYALPIDEEEIDEEEIDDGDEDEDETVAGETAEEDRAPDELTDEEQKVVADLAQRDREVRAHEQAHISAGGAYIRGGASYEYETGPDDKRYAVGGEVSIDSSPVRDNPEATIAKMQVVRAAAMAPAEPSAQDRAVAASASQEEAQARVELREKQNAETEEPTNERDDDAANENQNPGASDAARQPSRVIADALSAYTGVNAPQTQGGINFAA